MTITQTPAATTTYVSSCPRAARGECGCEKWADCDYCGHCSPEPTAAQVAHEAAYWAEYEEQQRPFWQFLYGED